jgi:hypothetical protein
VIGGAGHHQAAKGGGEQAQKQKHQIAFFQKAHHFHHKGCVSYFFPQLAHPPTSFHREYCIIAKSKCKPLLQGTNNDIIPRP